MKQIIPWLSLDHQRCYYRNQCVLPHISAGTAVRENSMQNASKLTDAFIVSWLIKCKSMVAIYSCLSGSKSHTGVLQI